MLHGLAGDRKRFLLISRHLFPRLGAVERSPMPDLLPTTPGLDDALIGAQPLSKPTVRPLSLALGESYDCGAIGPTGAPSNPGVANRQATASPPTCGQGFSCVDLDRRVADGMLAGLRRTWATLPGTAEENWLFGK